MRLLTIVTLALTVLHTIASPLSPSDNTGVKIPNQYIVIFKSNVNASITADHTQWLRASAMAGARAPIFRRQDMPAFPAIPKFDQFEFLKRFEGRFRGYTARISEDIARVLENLPEVAFVEQDSYVSIIGWAPVPRTSPTPAPQNPTQPNPPNWGLRRISKRELPLPSGYTYNSAAGANVDVYIIDSGVEVSHPEFGGRALASNTYGVAKRANIVAVKVLSGSGTGANSDPNLWPSFRRQHVSGGGASAALDQAIANAVASGVAFVVAAGTRTATPAITRLHYCVYVDWRSSRALSGTSMASPHVAGVFAIALSTGRASTPNQLASYVSSISVPDRISGLSWDTRNLLVQVPM
ncbi:peptidase S8/S53 domain-containing protein [Chytridium lagenaria]|nr:peptidase S8/S53 domain-containing protein [Chytridium lagenaria]